MNQISKQINWGKWAAHSHLKCDSLSSDYGNVIWPECGTKDSFADESAMVRRTARKKKFTGAIAINECRSKPYLCRKTEV